MIQALLGAHPRSASSVDRRGRLPLNLALEAGRTWRSGVRDIISACPDALFGTRDPATHLYPFMLAAVDHSRALASVETEEMTQARRPALATLGGLWRYLPDDDFELLHEAGRSAYELARLETTFLILRAYPEAVRGGIPPVGTGRAAPTHTNYRS